MWIAYNTTIIICGLTVTIMAAALSQADFDRVVQHTRETEPVRLQALGYDCSDCKTTVHGAPGPVMGVAGLPLVAGYGAYVLWRRRRKH